MRTDWRALAITGSLMAAACGSVGHGAPDGAAGAGGSTPDGGGGGGTTAAGGGGGGGTTGQGGVGTSGSGGMTSPDGGDARPTDAPAATCNLAMPFGAPVLLPSINSGFTEPDIWLTPDGRTAFFVSTRTDAGGPGVDDIYTASRASTSDSFGPATLVANINSANSDRKPVLSPDGLKLFFTSNRPVGDGGTGNNIFVATRPNALADFETPGTLAGANSAAGDLVNSITSDGKILYLDNTSGATRDIYTRDLTSSNPPVPVTELNSDSAESQAVISADSLTIYFGTTRALPGPDAGARTDFEIWVAHRATPTAPFGALAPVPELNSAVTDVPNWLSPDGCTIYISSDRNAPAGARHIWVASKPAQ